MTRYDPFSYGQVPLDKKQAGKPASPDDLLFADTGGSRPEPAADSSWALLEENVDNLLPGGGGGAAAAADFGREILGESAAPKPARIRAAPGSTKAVAASKPKAAVPAPAAPAARPRAARPESVAAMKETLAPQAHAPVRAAPTVTRNVLPMRRRPFSVPSLVASLAVAGGGAAATWWLHAMQHNTVMAVIAGVTTVVGAALAWVMLRR